MKYTLHIDKSEERGYPRLAFDVPEGAERIDVRVSYPEREPYREGEFTLARNECVIDLALESPDGRLFGAAGSNRTHVFVSPLGSSAGFLAQELPAGRWSVVAGAYHVPEGGVDVAYDVEITVKRRRLFRGDTHVHTNASDGAFALATLAELAAQDGLDYLFITDHNNVSAPPHRDDITLLPGVEWTHYNGHAGFLGADAPLPGRYDTRSEEETARYLISAGESGAMTVLNHPFCPLVPWLWSLAAPHDAIEVWNGIMSERNERAIAYWHGELVKGNRVVALGGSDYHRPGLFGSIATPCTMVYAPSRSRVDILAALRRGDCIVSYQQDGPTADVDCRRDGAPVSFGGAAESGAEVTLRFSGLRGGDEIRLVTDLGVESVPCPNGAENASLTRRYPGAAFVRAEVMRVYAPGLPPMKAMLTNPVYFD
ncbi:MAG: CehA/McbA family metallohydrolase [Clostridiales bacterium]|nr:CehA/McbA family metallohydrolase [Clostridiales bacterium]